jgi:23S rRNA (adenine2503-C2)-methyltransferase
MELFEEHVGRQNRRFAVGLDDGAVVECVLYRSDTLCVSTQVGCAVGCPFCASGARGFARNLSAAELWGQVEAVRHRGHALVRVTLSGVGEPLHNLEAVDAFVARCRREGIAPSVTTSGGPLPRLPALLGLHHNGVTVSVHAGTDATRARLVPRGPALSPLFAALARELPRLSRSRRRKIALAYLVLEGANDDDGEVDAFVARALPLELTVHLYAYNPVGTFRPVSRRRYEAIYQRMTDAGLCVRMSSRARQEPVGGCGTLVALRAPLRRPWPSTASS